MPDLERSDQRIQAICDKIRNETLDPAKEQAQEIIEQAHREAEQIRLHARQEANKIQSDMQRAMQEEKQIFISSLQQASKQAREELMQKIEESLFNPALASWVEKELGGASSHTKLIEVLIEAIQKEGIRADISVKIPKAFSPDEINASLSKEILDSLKGRSVQVSDVGAGVQVRMEGKKMVLDLSAKALEELIASFIRKDFRKVFFST